MKRLAIFGHYDAQGEVKAYVVHHLRALRSSCDRIVFVTTAAASDEELDKARTAADEVIVRPNLGYDFAMWKHVIEQIDLGAWDELLLTNSSVFGPLWSLDAAWAKMETADCDFWGMTDSHDYERHLQSYFLVFRRKVLDSDAFRRFWSSVLPYRNKWLVIWSYEIGLTTFLEEAGFRGRALAPAESLFQTDGLLSVLYAKKRRNPSCFYPLELLERGVPYVKVEVMRNNPGRVPLRKLLREMRRAGYDESLLSFDRPVDDHGLITPRERLTRIMRRKLRSVTPHFLRND